MKKAIKWLVTLAVVIAGGFGVYQLFFSIPVMEPLKDLGVAQTIQQGETVKNPGFYDVATSSGEQKIVGWYYGKGQGVDLGMNEALQLLPAKFSKLSEPYTLKVNGNYLVGTELPAGNYEAVFGGDLSTFTAKDGSQMTFPVTLDAYFLLKNGQRKEEANLELTNKKKVGKISLKNGELLQAKMPSGVSVTLKKIAS